MGKVASLQGLVDARKRLLQNELAQNGENLEVLGGNSGRKSEKGINGRRNNFRAVKLGNRKESKTVLLNIAPSQTSYLPIIQNILATLGFRKVIVTPLSLNEESLIHRMDAMKTDSAIICNYKTKLNLLCIKGVLNEEDWAGTVLPIQYANYKALICFDLAFLYKKPWGKLVITQHINKFLSSSSSYFSYSLPKKSDVTMVDMTNYLELIKEISSSSLVSIDIECPRHNRMSMVGYAALFPSGEIKTYVVDWTTTLCEETVHFVKKVNSLLMPKVFHNGTYDNQWFLRYNMPVTNYILDTEYLFYSIHAELPKSLAFVAGFYSPVARYWKHTASTDLAYYNALDCYNTLVTCMELLKNKTTFPEYARKNYKKVFSLVVPALWSAMNGLNIDQEELKLVTDKAQVDLDKAKADWDAMCGGEDILTILPSSPKQVAYLLYNVLGAKKLRVKGKSGGTDIITLAKLSDQHPILRRYIETLISYRKAAKSISTYYAARQYKGRLLWSYRIDGTTTGRLSAKQSNFSLEKGKPYGSQIQNQPSYIKSALIPDEGYSLCEVDKSQAEARCTAYFADDENLITALEDDTVDFYKKCGELFFNIPAEEVTSYFRNKVIKKIIHGTNYMMQEGTFVDIVGKTELVKAQRLLNRPQDETLLTFAAYLLSLYHKGFPKVAPWYRKTQMLLATEGKLVSPRGWTRISYSDPTASATLRAMVAHQPQNLSVDVLNEAFVKCFWLLTCDGTGRFKLIAQIHDSILSQIKKGYEEEYLKKVNDIMNIPVHFEHSGKTMYIPTDGSCGDTWKVCH